MNLVTPFLEERLISEAEFGLYELYAKITLKKAKELREKGFVVTDSYESKASPRLHKICWKEAGVYVFDYENVYNLDENDPKYSLSQRLWIISEKHKPSLKYL